MTTEHKKAEVLERRTVTMHPNTYQPSQAEKEEELDMPGADIETVHSAFFRPIKVEEQEQ